MFGLQVDGAVAVAGRGAFIEVSNESVFSRPKCLWESTTICATLVFNRGMSQV